MVKARLRHLSIAALLGLAVFPATAALAADPEAGRDLKLWYNKAPVAAPDAVLSSNGVWPDTLLIGNGRLGGQVWGNVQQDRIDLNEDSLWTGEPGYAVNPRSLQMMPEIRKLLLAGNYLGAQEIYNTSMGGKGSATYLPMGDVRIKFSFPAAAGGGDAAPVVQDYRRELDLNTAIVRTTFTVGGVHYVREVFASHPAQAIIVQLTADQPGKISFTASLASQLHMTVRADEGYVAMKGQAPMMASGYRGNSVVQPRYAPANDPRGMFWEARLAGNHEGGTVRYTEHGMVAENCTVVTLMIAARTSYNGPAASPSKEGLDPSALCAADITGISGQTYPNLRVAHINDYQPLFARVALDLGHSDAEKLSTDERVAKYQPGQDPSLPALYYQFGRYMALSASRLSGGAGNQGQPSNLQGLWSSSLNPPWSSNWTINCNAEINYWPVEAANLAECHEPLIKMVKELSVDGARVAKEIYGVRGWMAHHTTDVWKFAAPNGGNAQWSSFVCGGSWFCQHLWEHYAFSRDTEYLRDVWPTLKGAAQFHLDMLVEEPTHHWLVMSPDANFENQWKRLDGAVGSLCMGATPTMQMIRELFGNCIQGSKILNVDGEFRAELEKALPRLAPMQISPTTGQLQEYLEDWPHQAKAQVLSSWGAVCSSQINPRGTPELAAGLKKIFDTERWWERDCVGSWEGAFQANSYARLHDGATAVKVLDRHLQLAVLPNLGSCFIGHPPQSATNKHPGMFQVDGNFGQTSAINEMLLQSQVHDTDGVYEVELLPALPPGWTSGQVRGLRARGGFEVDMTWTDGKLTAARVTERSAASATSSVKTRLRYGDKVFERTFAKGEYQDITPASFK